MCCLFKIKIQGVVLTCQNKFISQFIPIFYYWFEDKFYDFFKDNIKQHWALLSLMYYHEICQACGMVDVGLCPYSMACAVFALWPLYVSAVWSVLYDHRCSMLYLCCGLSMLLCCGCLCYAPMLCSMTVALRWLRLCIFLDSLVIKIEISIWFKLINLIFIIKSVYSKQFTYYLINSVTVIPLLLKQNGRREKGYVSWNGIGW